MSFLINQNLSVIVYPKNLPFTINNIDFNLKKEGIIASQWQMLAVINETNQKESIAGISLKYSIFEVSKIGKRCICNKDITQYCLIGNKYNGTILHLGFECIQKFFESSEVFNDYKLAKQLIRKCKKCSNRFLITDMIGKCCNGCRDARTSNCFGCISCLAYEKGFTYSSHETNVQTFKQCNVVEQQPVNITRQCTNCQIAKRPYYQIKRCTGSFEDIVDDSTELTYTGSGFMSQRTLSINKKESIITEQQCTQCNVPIILEEQLRAVPLDQIHKCVSCVYPNHGRCVGCNKFMPEKIAGKDKCIACFKKLMRSQPKRQCNTCGLLEIPNLPSNMDKTQCYSCWKKSK
jgi:hypothetical protein